MIKRIKKYFTKRKFIKLCNHIPCTYCPNFIYDHKDGRCKLAEDLGLEN